MGLAVARPVLIAQADTGDAVDEDESVGVQFTGSLQLLVALADPEESQLLNIIQPAHLAGQLHYRERRTQDRQLRPHQGLVGHHMAVGVSTTLQQWEFSSSTSRMSFSKSLRCSIA